MHFQLLMLKALMRTQNISKFEVKWNIHFVIYMNNLIVMCNVKYVSKDSELNLEILLNQFTIKLFADTFQRRDVKMSSGLEFEMGRRRRMTLARDQDGGIVK